MSNPEMIRKFIGEKVRYDEFGGGYIWGDHGSEGEQMVAQLEDRPKERPIVSIRGWGAIQHLFKTAKEAAAFQDELGRWIAEAINEKLERESTSGRGDSHVGGKEESHE